MGPFIIFLLLASGFATVAQPSQPNMLCQGAYYTEPQGAEQLAKVSKSLKSLGDWSAHADSMRAQIRKGLDMEAYPKKTPLNAKFRNKKTFDGYTVEAVIFESLPGFYVTGNLYRPTGDHRKQSLAVIANAHGHGNPVDDYPRIRPDMQARCASFARMGAIVFAFDMIGYGESRQLDHKYPRTMTLQAWNAQRVIDFLLSFPEADPKRVAFTGASGGGTQTFIATALDNRITVSAPVVMVSAHFFGGCVCESGLQVHRTGDKVFSNAEIACLAAPRPMILVSDGGDWTKNNPDVEFPFAQKVYGLYGKSSSVENTHFADEKHDYGISKRLAVYPFFGKHLGLNLKSITNNSGAVDESFATIQERKDLEYFNPGEIDAFLKGELVYDVFLKAKQ
jgi:hypothetical protein